MDEFVSLLQCGKSSPNFYVLDHHRAEAVQPTPGEVIWPVEFLLKYHRKHVFPDSRLPPLRDISMSVATWENKLRWRLHHHNSQDHRWGHLRCKPSAAPTYPCQTRFSNQIDSWFTSAREAIFKEAKNCLHQAQVARRGQRCRCLLFSFAFKILQSSEYVPILSDKDGGFCLVDRAFYKQERLRILADTGTYKRFHAYGDDLAAEAFTDFKHSILSVWDDIPCTDDEKKDLLSTMLQPWRYSQNLACKLKTSVKTHKDVVTFRALHAGSNNPMGAGMKLIMDLLHPGLAAISHLLPSSRAFVKQLRSMKFECDTTWIKLDIVDYFMSGTHQDFISGSSLLVAIAWKPLYISVLKSILYHQYVVNDNDFYSVLRGAGMGLALSGDVSDASFYIKAEHNFITNSQAMEKVGVQRYWRYKDDVLVAHCGSPAQRLRFIQALRAKSRSWKIKVEGIYSNNVPFLDIEVFKDSNFQITRQFHTKVYHKPSAQKRPLGVTSNHPPSVHTQWPLGMLRRAESLCSSRRGLQEEVVHLHRFFSHRFGPGYAKLILESSSKPSQSSLGRVKSFISFKWSPIWNYGSMRAVLRNCAESFPAFELQLRMCFKLAGEHFHQRCYKLAHETPEQVYSIF